MVTEEYLEARKLAERDHRRCERLGVYPYLIALEDLVPEEEMTDCRDMGLREVPSDFIVGTSTRARGSAFARNFMPLLGADTEFAEKWDALCRAQLEEGIRDPVTVFEYRNRYYVAEGNKRVSVLKFFGAASVPCEVTRVMPKEDGSRDLALYRELMRFEELSGICYAEFSRTGSFAELQKRTGKGHDEAWTPEEQQRFAALYSRFRPLFRALTEESPELTCADALLILIRIYGYGTLCDMPSDELGRTLDKAKQEILLLKQEEPVELQLDPDGEKKAGFWGRLFRNEPLPLHAAFLYDGAPETSGWVLGHEMGRARVQKSFGGALETTAVFRVLEADPDEALEKAVRDGNRILFTPTPLLQTASLRCAMRHPEVTVFNCSLNSSHRYIRTYHARMYEAKFVLGAVAGALAGGSPVGYVCDYPIPGQVAGVNAFALGVAMVAPGSRVELEWSCTGGAEEACRRLAQKGVRIISSLDMASLHGYSKGEFGLFSARADGSPEARLARPVWDWGVYYEALLDRFRSRSLEAEYNSTEAGLSYYWGMSAGVIGVKCTDAVPNGTRHLCDIISRSIVTGQCSPFRGEIRGADGACRGMAGNTLPVEAVIGMDWLVENVAGAIPAYEELNEKARAVVEQMGFSNGTESGEGQK